MLQVVRNEVDTIRGDVNANGLSSDSVSPSASQLPASKR